MRRFKRLAIGSLLVALAGGLGAKGADLATNTYTTSTEEFPNPERGFYIQADRYASAPSSIPSNLASWRLNGKSSPGGVYEAKISLLMRVFYLDTFVASPISSNFLCAVQSDFDSVRAQGDKMIVRFAYNHGHTRPFTEPTKARILEHIGQLKPMLGRNSDVIAVVQEGLIGAWGEGYFTDVFYTNGQASAQNWRDRADIISALLDALPKDRMIQVRTPEMKQKYLVGPEAPTGLPTLSSNEAFSGSAAARIGFHNDCYLADSTDKGTFSSHDLGKETSEQDVANLRNYLAQDARFTPMGGETCALNPPTDDCAAVGGNADPEMAYSHYSFLNQDYNVAVDNKWAAHGCMEDIKRRLGYRLQLVSGVFRTQAQPGQVVPISLQFQNTGFASLFNPRGIELILREATTGRKYFAELSRDTDARRWLPGTNYFLNADLLLPANLPMGNYEMLLNFPDPAPALYTNVAYSIRLANSNAVSSTGANLGDVWESDTGYHRLRQMLTINSTATSAPGNGRPIRVLDYSAIAVNGPRASRARGLQ